MLDSRSCADRKLAPWRGPIPFMYLTRQISELVDGKVRGAPVLLPGCVQVTREESHSLCPLTFQDQLPA